MRPVVMIALCCIGLPGLRHKGMKACKRLCVTGFEHGLRSNARAAGFKSLQDGGDPVFDRGGIVILCPQGCVDPAMRAGHRQHRRGHGALAGDADESLCGRAGVAASGRTDKQEGAVIRAQILVGDAACQ